MFFRGEKKTFVLILLILSSISIVYADSFMLYPDGQGIIEFWEEYQQGLIAVGCEQNKSWECVFGTEPDTTTYLFETAENETP